MTWQDRAACRDADNPDEFHDAPEPRLLQLAATYCAACPVVGECEQLGQGRVDGVPYNRLGLWGGITPPQRRNSGALRLAALRRDPAVREAHSLGLSDTQIGLRIGASCSSVREARKRLDLPANMPPGGPRTPVANRVSA